MTTAWTRGIAVGLLAWPLGCEVTVNDGPFDTDAGAFAGRAGFGGRAGNSGSSGQGGAAGGMSGSGGMGGSVGGSGGSAAFPAPTCDPEGADANDPCRQCLKQECCSDWLACDDQSCYDEWTDTVSCVLMEDFVDQEGYGTCVSDSATEGMIPQANTNSLLSCMNFVPETDAGFGPSYCGEACFGYDIF